RLTLHPNRHQFFRLVRTSTRPEDVARVLLRLHQACDQQRPTNVDLVVLPIRLNKRPNHVRNKTLPTRLPFILQRATQHATCPKVSVEVVREPLGYGSCRSWLWGCCCWSAGRPGVNTIGWSAGHARRPP